MGKETVNGRVYWVEVFLTIKHFEKRSESKLRHFQVVLSPSSSKEKKITVEMLIYSVKGLQL